MASPDARPFRALDAAAAEALLDRNRVGRIAYTFRGRLEVEPVLYGFAEGTLWLRTAFGQPWAPSADGVASGTPVVFEVDEVQEGGGWRCAVARGTLHPVEHPADGGDPAAWMYVVDVIRDVDPAGAADMGALRGSLARLAVHEVTGRETLQRA